MNTYLFSIHPKWCEKIFNGEKTIEARKTAPKPPFKVVVYCTKGEKLYLDYEGMIKGSGGYHINENNSADNYNDQLLNGKVIGEFIVNEVDKAEVTSDGINTDGICNSCFIDMPKATCLTLEELQAYVKIGTDIKLLHITAPVLYDKPKELGEFRHKQPKDCCGASYGNYCEGERTDVYCKYVKDYRCTNKVNHAPQSYMRIEEDTI